MSNQTSGIRIEFTRLDDTHARPDSRANAGWSYCDGNHGSGRHCLSHYISKLRLVSYDSTGNPGVRVISEADELNAARCSLGAMGIVTEVTIPIRRQYSIEEHFREYDALERVLAAEEEYPIQQFFFLPWKWTYLAQHRRETHAKRSWHAPIYRLFWVLGMDRGLHWIIMALPDGCRVGCAHWLFRFILPRLFLKTGMWLTVRTGN